MDHKAIINQILAAKTPKGKAVVSKPDHVKMLERFRDFDPETQWIESKELTVMEKVIASYVQKVFPTVPSAVPGYNGRAHAYTSQSLSYTLENVTYWGTGMPADAEDERAIRTVTETRLMLQPVLVHYQAMDKRRTRNGVLPKEAREEERLEQVKGALNPLLREALEELKEKWRKLIFENRKLDFEIKRERAQEFIKKNGHTVPKKPDLPYKVKPTEQQQKVIDLVDRYDMHMNNGSMFYNANRTEFIFITDAQIARKADEIAKKEANSWFGKMADKLGGFITSINKKLIKVQDMHNSKTPFESTIWFTFSDNSRFSIVNTIEIATSSLGTAFYRYVTRFTSAYLSDGSKVASPDEYTVKAAFLKEEGQTLKDIPAPQKSAHAVQKYYQYNYSFRPVGKAYVPKTFFCRQYVDKLVLLKELRRRGLFSEHFGPGATYTCRVIDRRGVWATLRDDRKVDFNDPWEPPTSPDSDPGTGPESTPAGPVPPQEVPASSSDEVVNVNVPGFNLEDGGNVADRITSLDPVVSSIYDAIQDAGNKVFRNPFNPRGIVINDWGGFEMLRTYDQKEKMEIYLSSLFASTPGKGDGSKVLRALTDAADKLGITIYLAASPYGDKGLSKKDLIPFYKRHGFHTVIGQYGMKSADSIEKYVLKERYESLEMRREPANKKKDASSMAKGGEIDTKLGILIHYGHTEYHPAMVNPIENDWVKPKGGLWTSPVNSNCGWAEVSHGIRHNHIENSFRISLHSDANIFIINSVDDLHKAPRIPASGYDAGKWYLDFETLAKEYDAIWLTEKGAGETHSDHSIALMRGWDCETVLIMNPKCCYQVSSMASGGELKDWHSIKSEVLKNAHLIQTAAKEVAFSASVVLVPGDIVFVQDELNEVIPSAMPKDQAKKAADMFFIDPNNFYFIDRIIPKGDSDKVVLRNEGSGRERYLDLQKVFYFSSNAQRSLGWSQFELDFIYGAGKRFTADILEAGGPAGASLDMPKSLMDLLAKEGHALISAQKIQEESASEYEQWKVVEQRTHFFVVQDYAGNGGNPIAVEEWNTLDEAKADLEALTGPVLWENSHSNHYAFIRCSLQERTAIYEATGDGPDTDYAEYEEVEKWHDIVDSDDVEGLVNNFGSREGDAQELLFEVRSNLPKDVCGTYSVDGVDVILATIGSDKYNNLWVSDSEGNELGYIELRIANHSYNPSNNNFKSHLGFISVVIANKDETQQRFHGRYNLRYGGDADYGEIVSEVKERISEILDSVPIPQKKDPEAADGSSSYEAGGRVARPLGVPVKKLPPADAATGGYLTGIDENGKVVIHTDTDKGGLLFGNRHFEGGIQGVNQSTGQRIEVETEEAQICGDAVSDPTKRLFDGEMLTNREILSRLNQQGGGVAFEAGGDLSVRVPRNQTHIFEGNTMTAAEIATTMRRGGVMDQRKPGPLKYKGGEVIITRPAVSADDVHIFEGERLKNREIMSRINQLGGGIAFADGGEIPDTIYATGKRYEVDGVPTTDYNIILRSGRQFQYSGSGIIEEREVAIGDILDTNSNGQKLADAVIGVLENRGSRTPGKVFLKAVVDKYEIEDGFHRIAQARMRGAKTIIADVLLENEGHARNSLLSRQEMRSGGATIARRPQIMTFEDFQRQHPRINRVGSVYELPLMAGGKYRRFTSMAFTPYLALKEIYLEYMTTQTV